LIKDDVPLNIVGSDIDQEAVDIALTAAKNAGFSKDIKLKLSPVAHISPEGEYGCIITNPPYGERIGSYEEVERVSRQLGKVAKRLRTWSHFIISPNRNFETLFERRADKRRKLFNGQIECTLYQYFGPLPPRN